MNDVLAERCDRLRDIILELTPLMIEVQGNASRLGAVLPVVQRLRAVANEGADGIDNPSYRQWAGGAPSNIDALEEAARAGDAEAAWRAFADQESGVNLLSTACAGYPGW
ncbi:MAG: hypothetical protein IR160_05625 [Salinibacterium sp.]|nr:hypothetical protein [Salinibacterium sp.]MBF0672049.1 hypothetical protein [Salinibacterium sp.]